MSERESFITEQINCPKCLAAIEAAFSRLKPRLIEATCKPTDRVIAGFAYGSYPGEVASITMECEFKQEVLPLLCHPFSMVVLNGEADEVWHLKFQPN